MRTDTLNIVQRGFLAVLVMALVFGCSYEFPEEPEESVGELSSADLSSVVFLGGSNFSGVNNGALLPLFSDYSLPQIFMNHIQGNDISSWSSFSPSVETENGFNIYKNDNLSETVGQYRIYYPTGDTTDFKISTTAGESFAYSNVGESITNYSFPKAMLADFTEAGRIVNPYLGAFNLNGGGSVTSQAVATGPTFFVLNLGYEDLLGHAITGAEGDIDVANAQDVEYGDLMSDALFAQKLDEVVDAFLANNPDTKGALINIPYFLNFPYFINVWYDLTPYVIDTPVQSIIGSRANQYNGALENYYRRNPGISRADWRSFLDFGQNMGFDNAYDWGIVVQDESLPEAYDTQGNLIPPVRHSTREERVFMSIENGLFSSKGGTFENALSEDNYLSESEIALIESKITSYNQIIVDKVANSNGRLTLIDFHSYFEELYDGLNLFLNSEPDGTLIDGVNFFPGISNFGIFSADGLNLNPRGNALFINVLIESLNQSFGGELEKVDPNAFAGTPIYTSEQ